MRFARFVNSLFSLTNEILRTLAPVYTATHVRNTWRPVLARGAAPNHLGQACAPASPV